MTVGLLLYSSSSLVLAQAVSRQFDEPEWTEQEVTLPSFPKIDSLVTVQLSGAARFEFRIDRDSIIVGSDGVVRYSIVARSPGGASNVSFEGVRCGTRERKLYAVGTPMNSWSRIEATKWQDIRGGGGNAYHESLALNYLCDGKLPMSTASKIVERLRRR